MDISQQILPTVIEANNFNDWCGFENRTYVTTGKQLHEKNVSKKSALHERSYKGGREPETVLRKSLLLLAVQSFT